MFRKCLLGRLGTSAWGALAILSASHPAFAQSFRGLGDLPGDQYHSIAHGVSANGMVVVGSSRGVNGVEAFVWNQEDGMVGLGQLPGGTIFSIAHGVSADGTVVVGESLSTPGFQAFYWTKAGGMVGLDDLPGGAFSCTAYDVSADGAMAVGFATSDHPDWYGEACRWHLYTGIIESLGVPPPDTVTGARAYGVSRDGSVVVGSGPPWRWTSSSGMERLPDPPTNPPGQAVSALGISDDGAIVVGSSDYADATPRHYRACYWQAAGPPVDIGTVSADGSTQAYDASADGTVIVGGGWDTTTNAESAFIWDAQHGMRILKTVLESEYGLDLSGWTLTRANAISPEGRAIVGEGKNPSGATEAWLALLEQDSDGDGLYDSWETDGIDFNGDGTIDLDLPALGARPDHKDIFVEVDAMADRSPANHAISPAAVAAGLATGTVLDLVTEAFLNAPVENPDEIDGIDLHIQLDELNLTRATWRDDPWPDFDALKADRFGTFAQRNDVNKANILGAKRLVYRYCVFADRRASNTISGQGELPGNDFMVTLGGWDPPGGTPGMLAGTFMHELGHTLGLRHGGVDNVTYKPNYYSVMNYTWQTPRRGYSQFWQLDYSRQALDALDESLLDEAVGIGGDPAVLVPCGPPMPGHAHPRLVNMGGSADWNRDGDDDDVGVVVDLNRLWASKPASPGDLLIGHEDWSGLVYNFRGTAAFPDGVHPTPNTAAIDDDEMSFEDHLDLDRIGCDPGDFDCDGDVDAVDYVEWKDCFTGVGHAARSGCNAMDLNGEGSVNLADFSVFQTLFGG